jgi:aspartyl-tRNA(Asn)/glutamyl-tRNA(Gln) amidotransferase subunit A
MQTSLTRLTLAEAAEQVKLRRISSVELTKACLSLIEQLNPVLNAFITVNAESALNEAAEADREIGSGNWRGPLHGIPMGLKDLIDQKDVPTTAASAVLMDTVAVEDAEVTRRLREAGAVLIGKLNLHEFAYGGSGIISHFGPVRNPWDTARITGGSSSGSAAAVAVGMCFAALGTDTAGSIRLPAAYCGIVGLKPSFGLVSRRGVFPLALSFDHVGPMTRTVEDAAIVLDAIAGYDDADPGSQKFFCAEWRKFIGRDTAKLRVGVADEYFFAGTEPEVESRVRAAVAQMAAPRPSEVCEVTVPIDEDRTAHVYEAYQYHQQFLAEYRDQYDPQTLNRILQGKDTTEQQYRASRCSLDAIRRKAGEIFRDVDVLITPTVPVSPALIADLQTGLPELRKRELTMLRNTRPFNVLGLPTITVPCGFTNEGLPVGMQISAGFGAESKVLAIAHQFEQSTEWHNRVPRVLES